MLKISLILLFTYYSLQEICNELIRNSITMLNLKESEIEFSNNKINIEFWFRFLFIINGEYPFLKTHPINSSVSEHEYLLLPDKMILFLIG